MSLVALTYRFFCVQHQTPTATGCDIFCLPISSFNCLNAVWPYFLVANCVFSQYYTHWTRWKWCKMARKEVCFLRLCRRVGESIIGPRQANLCLRAFRHDKFQLRMPSYSEGPGIWLSVWRFLLTHCLYERAAEVLARLRGCAGSPEPSLLA